MASEPEARPTPQPTAMAEAEPEEPPSLLDLPDAVLELVSAFVDSPWAWRQARGRVGACAR